MTQFTLKGRIIKGCVTNNNPWLERGWYSEKDIQQLHKEILGSIIKTIDFGAGEDVASEKFIFYHILKVQIDELFGIKDKESTTVHYIPR